MQTEHKSLRSVKIRVPSKGEIVLDEYNPYKLNTREKLIKHWSNTSKDEYLISLRKRMQTEHKSLRI
ncbi:unnamed protein product, partial [Onchocerca flexuosa]|uniref:Uncharacterized protein n=1 Tax=Onchocerca flexuosa TaxID=387005 RepID=A0A183I6W8_9BILA